ncbi:craniofacial development protein 2-like [Plakobranchus ocellatus]|uniref:Craniofacial development protein 2-like n=1 Tax=Plakobranchus ocellatus TaxID=259542 RepID=A0AAV3ZGY5_9GAST|nr:craniofacial development protein 2-like [Plakobranchus ocellatus]
MIIMRYFNAKVGDERVSDVVGPSGIGTVNERGSKLIEFECSQINDFTIQSLGIKTILYDNGFGRTTGMEAEKKIDYILIQKRFRNAIKTSNSPPGADCDSYYIPLMGKF